MTALTELGQLQVKIRKLLLAGRLSKSRGILQGGRFTGSYPVSRKEIGAILKFQREDMKCKLTAIVPMPK
jgi:hypothetical protein